MIFRDRNQAARALEEKLSRFHADRPVILGVPRGAVPMARIIADALDGKLDLSLVHKFSLPDHPEFALGSVTEDGEIYLGSGAKQVERSRDELNEAASLAIAHLRARRRLYTPHRHSIDIRDRTVILVDDGIATGATMTAAVRNVKQRGAKKIVVATPVASGDAVERLEAEGAEVVALYVPTYFYAVSQFYEDFSEVTDSDVVRALEGETPETTLRLDGVTLKGYLVVPDEPQGLILFAHGSGSGRRSPRNQLVARELNDAGFATLLVDLLDEHESDDRARVFDIQLLARRLTMIEEWMLDEPVIANLPLGLFGASTGAAAAIVAAGKEGSRVSAIVSRGGRPDLADEYLEKVRAPTLLVVGGDDEPVLTWNRQSFLRLQCVKELVVIAGATHLFEEADALEQVASVAQTWFERHLVINPRKAATSGFKQAPALHGDQI